MRKVVRGLLNGQPFFYPLVTGREWSPKGAYMFMIALVFIILKLVFWITSWIIITSLQLLIIPLKAIWFLTFGWIGLFRQKKQRRNSYYDDALMEAIIWSEIIND